MRLATKLACAVIFGAALPGSAQVATIPPGTGVTAKAYAPFDITGYWVALVTEDWRYRFLTAPKGDYYSIPLNNEGKRVADQWDAQKDIAEGKQCLGYGAPGIMRQPARVHITWQNDNALRVEIDAGKQTRDFLFGSPKPPTGVPTLQGFSVAKWETPQITRFYSGKINAQDPNTPGFSGQTPRGEPPADTRKLGGTLKVVTTHLSPSYLRNNGVLFSPNAVLTEYYDVHKASDGNDYMLITSVVDDPQYLYVPWVTTNHFRREPDGAKWDPHPCELILPSKK